MGVDIEYDKALEAKETLIAWLEQEVDLNYTVIASPDRINDRLLYLTLKLEHGTL